MTLRDLQETELNKLINKAKQTRFGRKHHFSDLKNYRDFKNEVPLSFYTDIDRQIDDLKDKVKDVFWPGLVKRFAVSAGTSGDGKHLPLTKDRLKADQRFMRKVLRSYLSQRPNIFKLWGKHISLPGSLEKSCGFEIGEISAFTAQQAPWWLSPFQLIDTQELIQLPFSKKIDRTIKHAVGENIKVISSTPSWLLTIFQRVLKKTKSNSITKVWPNLQLLVCGGVKLANYRPHLEKLLNNPEIDFIETYGASEGYFSFTDDLEKDDMKLVIDNGIFYEFIPDPLPSTNSLAIQQTIPLWQVKPGTPYAMIISSNSGLWRYALNDIVQFTKTTPPRIKVMGRVNEMLDDYGEALYAYEAEQALQEAAEGIGLETGTFTIVASLDNEQSLPRHHWFVQTYGPIHTDTLNRLAQKIDEILQSKNRHYAIRRESEAVGIPTVKSIDQQQINDWLREKGKQKAQSKLPTILNTEDIRFFK